MAASNLCDSQLRNRKERRKEKEPVRSASPCLFVFFFFCFCTDLSYTCIHFFFLFQIGDILWQQWLWKSHSTWQIVLLFPLKKRVMNTQLFFFPVLVKCFLRHLFTYLKDAAHKLCWVMLFCMSFTSFSLPPTSFLFCLSSCPPFFKVTDFMQEGFRAVQSTRKGNHTLYPKSEFFFV